MIFERLRFWWLTHRLRNEPYAYDLTGALSEFMEKASTSFLISALANRDEEIRTEAAGALGSRAAQAAEELRWRAACRAVPSLIAALNDSSLMVRYTAADRLGTLLFRLKDPRSVKPLIEALIAKLKSGTWDCDPHGIYNVNTKVVSALVGSAEEAQVCVAKIIDANLADPDQLL